jgi:hypothetical protein
MGILSSEIATAQKKPNDFLRCATMTRLHLHEANNPLLKTANEAKSKAVLSGPGQGAYRLQGTVTIPVVVHIVMPNPFHITDEDVQAQIDRLNQDFAGLNPDSSNATAFYNVRGHSFIQFSLARRTPGGLATNGIERRFSTIGSDANANTDPIKHTSMGGLDSWNTDQYLNLWIGIDASGAGILGYANGIGPDDSADDGVFLNYEGFGSSSCYTDPRYNKGRTATHEVGHYFGLYHIWGDDNGSCTGDDFSQLPAATNCSLPAGLYNPAGSGNGSADVGDTPNQGDMTINCPSGTATDDCSRTAPGKMYQNYMDYTQDACLTMFTKKQVARMEWVLDNCRSSLKTSPGNQAPTGGMALDVAPLASVSPGGFDLVGCQSVYYPDTLSCPGILTPKFRVVNNGVETITSLTVGYSYDGGVAVTQTLSVNIPQNGTYVVSFVPITVTVGNHTLRFFTASPNGGTDQVISNDNFTQSFTVMAPATVPVAEGFETPLPIANWTIDNPNYDFTWQRTTPGRNGSAGKLSIDNYTGDGQHNRDDFRSTGITVDPTGTYVLTFDVAHKNYPDSRYYDSLAVLVSNDCGQTFTRVYYKGGPVLATAGSSSLEYNTPSDADWRTESVSLPASLLSSGKIVIVFRNISGFGNWIHLDNINLVKIGARDLRLSEILSPGTTACSGTIAPSVSIENMGLENVSSFSVAYTIDNGPAVQQTFNQTIAPGATVTVSLPQSTTELGAHTLTAFSFDPVTISGSGDSRVNNDTLEKTFTVVSPVKTPVVESFEKTFPSAGWSILNPDNNVTWKRTTPGHNSTYAGFFDNYNNNVVGETDDIRTPFMDVSGADSVIVRFDLAYKEYPGASGDEFSVLATTDCANSFMTVYSKVGAALATADNTSDEYLTPKATDWRTESITLGTQAVSTGRLGLLFRNTNGYGNNIFLDNISVETIYKCDVRLTAIQQPKNFVCSSTITPSVVVRNMGMDTVKSFTVVYRVNNGTAVTQTVSSLFLARGTETVVNLPQISGLNPGSYHLDVFTTDLATSKGTGDMNTENDTLSITFAVPGTAMTPVVENFVNPVFQPNGWTVLNNDAASTWQWYQNGNGNSGSAFLNTYNYDALGQIDDLVTPVISYGAVDSVKLSFDVAAATYSFPGSTDVPLDTLEVLVTKDCGNSFTTVYKKWGAALQTTSDPTSPYIDEFFPTASQWRKETIDLSQFATQSPVVVFFRVINNNENNVFLDNINISTKTLPSQLKQQGYLVYPAPFQNSFTVWHFQTPTALKYIRVMNAAGQMVWLKQYNSNAERQEVVDITGKASGVYFVEMGYSDGRKVVSQKVLKQ